MNFIFNDNVRILCLSCNVKKLVRFKQKGQKQVSFVIRVTLVPVSYLSAPSAVHSYRVPGKFIYRLKSLFRLVRIKQTFIRIAYLYSKCTDCRISLIILLYYTPAPRRGRGVYCFTSVRPSKIFFVAFFSVTVDGRNLIFEYHIVGSVFGLARFLLPVCRLSWFLYTLNIYAHFSSHFSQQLLMAEI